MYFKFINENKSFLVQQKTSIYVMQKQSTTGFDKLNFHFKQKTPVSSQGRKWVLCLVDLPLES